MHEYATVVHHRTGHQFRHPQWWLQAKWWGCCICSGKSQELQCSSRKLIFVRLRGKIEAMRQKRDKKCRGQPQSVPVFLFLHFFTLSFRLSLPYSNCIFCCYGYLCGRIQQRCGFSYKDIKRGATLSTHSRLCQQVNPYFGLKKN